MESSPSKTRATQHYAKNPWHYVPYGADAPKYVNAII